MTWRYRVRSYVLGARAHLEFDEKKTPEQVKEEYVEGLGDEVGSLTAGFVKEHIVVDLVDSPDQQDKQELQDDE